jgi:hypothetical protein
VLLIVNLAVIPFLLVVVTSGSAWQQKLLTLGAVLAADVLVLGLFWLLNRLVRRFPAHRQVHHAEERFERENPDVVVVLKPRQEQGLTADARPALLRATP